jgi:hypothetical protein
METIIHLDDQLFSQAQECAQAAGQTLDAFVAQSLKNSLEKQPPASSDKKFDFPRVSGSILMPGVDLNNNAELLDIMEEGLDVSKRH